MDWIGLKSRFLDLVLKEEVPQPDVGVCDFVLVDLKSNIDLSSILRARSIATSNLGGSWSLISASICPLSPFMN